MALCLTVAGVVTCIAQSKRDQEQGKIQDRGGLVTDAKKAVDLAQLRAECRGELVRQHLGLLARYGEAGLYRGNAARLLIDAPKAFAGHKGGHTVARHCVLLEGCSVEDEGGGAEVAEQLLRQARPRRACMWR